MRVLGVDPGITNTGYGLVVEESGRLKAAEFGSVRTTSSADMSHRLDTIYGEIKGLIKESTPDIVVLEQLFFSTNLKTAFSVGQARGVILLACKHADVTWTEYTPLQVKQTVVGSGNASKEQVKYMVVALLGLSDPPASLHACDALAIAICHLHMRRIKEMTGR